MLTLSAEAEQAGDAMGCAEKGGFGLVGTAAGRQGHGRAVGEGPVAPGRGRSAWERVALVFFTRMLPVPVNGIWPLGEPRISNNWKSLSIVSKKKMSFLSQAYDSS